MTAKNTSLYDAPRLAVWNEFSTYLQGADSSLFCVVSDEEVSLDARTALLSVANRLGYGQSVCFITLKPNVSRETISFAIEPYDVEALSGKNLFRVIETLDPVCLVCCNQETASALATAYHCAISLECTTSLLNRPFRGFVDLDKWLLQDQGKQKAWQLLKTLPSL